MARRCLRIRNCLRGTGKDRHQRNHAVLITGLGPVGLAAAALSRKLGASKIIGIDVVPERMKIAVDLRLCDAVLTAGP